MSCTWNLCEPSTEYSSRQLQCSAHGQRLREHYPRFPFRGILQCWWPQYEMNHKAGSLANTVFIQGCPESFTCLGIEHCLLKDVVGVRKFCITFMLASFHPGNKQHSYWTKDKGNIKQHLPNKKLELNPEIGCQQRYMYPTLQKFEYTRKIRFLS